MQEASGFDLIKHGTVSDADTIRDTAVAQPLIVAAGIATAATLFAGKSYQQGPGDLGVVDAASMLLPPATNVIDGLLAHRDTDGELTMPRFIGKKLWEWFAYKNPSKTLVDEITATCSLPVSRAFVSRCASTEDLNALWWELVEKYQQVRKPKGRSAPDYGSKIHICSAPVYYHNYMMGQLFASQVHHALSKELGTNPSTTIYIGDKRVGDFMKKKVFEPGKTLSWNELTRHATGEGLNAKYFARDFKGK